MARNFSFGFIDKVRWKREKERYKEKEEREGHGYIYDCPIVSLKIEEAKCSFPVKG